MRKRGFFIPMIVLFSLASLAFTFELYLSGIMVELIINPGSDVAALGSAFGFIFGMAGIIYLTVFIVALSLPVWILGGIYRRKAKLHNKITWPAIAMGITCIGYSIYPAIYYFFVFVLSKFINK